LRDTFFLAAKLLAQGQTNFVRMLWKFNQVYNPQRQVADHYQAVRYEMSLPRPVSHGQLDRKSLYIHRAEPARAVG
jgi:magnesium-protoporphyrin IX monomethyl ester (oxidative) cyclase